MSENDKNLFPWQRPLRDSNPISQESSTPVGLPAGEKTAKIGRVLFEQLGLEGAVQTGSSFGSQGHPRSLWMVPFDKDKISYIFSWGRHVPISHRFGVTVKKIKIAENENWSLKIQKSRFRPFVYSHGRTE